MMIGMTHLRKDDTQMGNRRPIYLVRATYHVSGLIPASKTWTRPSVST